MRYRGQIFVFSLLGNQLSCDFFTENFSNKLKLNFVLMMLDKYYCPTIFKFKWNVILELKKSAEKCGKLMSYYTKTQKLKFDPDDWPRWSFFTMKNMKVMKIIHESVNERANGRVHSLTPVFDSFRAFSCLSWLKLYFSVFSVNSVVKKCIFVFFCVFCGRHMERFNAKAQSRA